MRPYFEIWLAAGIRTPFARSDGPLSRLDAIELSVPVARRMLGLLGGAVPDFAGLGHRRAEPDLEQHRPRGLMDAGSPATIPAFSTVVACSTSMIGAIEAAGMIDGADRNLALVGGVDVLEQIPFGLAQPLSDWIVKFQPTRPSVRSYPISSPSTSGLAPLRPGS